MSSDWHAVSCRGSHLSCGFESHRGHFLTLFEQNRSPPASTKRTNQSRKELLFRLHVWAVTGMVPAPSGLAFLATHSCRRAASDAWYGVPTTLPTLHPHRRRRPPSPTRRQREARTRYPFRQPQREEPRLANMTSTPARLPLPRKRIASRLPRRRQRTTVSSRPGSVTISFKNGDLS